jgi:hypothetical protein
LSQRSYGSLSLVFFTSLACSSSGSPAGGAGGTTGSGGAPGSGGAAAVALAFKPCDVSKRVGGFSLQLVGAKPMDDPPAAAYTQLNGGVLDRVDPATLWQTADSDGDCKLIVGPTLVCNPACGTGQVCAGQNACSPQPVSQSVGNVNVTGLSAPLALMPISSYKVVYYGALPATAAYPPFAAEGEVKLSADGAGSLGAFTLAGRGIEPLSFPGTGLKVVHDQALAVSWTPPARAGSARVLIALDIAHHGGVAARVECDVVDSGAATIPGPLLTKLIARGTAGFPTLTVTRRTVDATTIAPGCVDFTVASSVERDVEVENVESCRDAKPCPSGRTCGVDQKCK